MRKRREDNWNQIERKSIWRTESKKVSHEDHPHMKLRQQTMENHIKQNKHKKEQKSKQHESHNNSIKVVSHKWWYIDNNDEQKQGGESDIG